MYDHRQVVRRRRGPVARTQGQADRMGVVDDEVDIVVVVVVGERTAGGGAGVGSCTFGVAGGIVALPHYQVGAYQQDWGRS
eukprot:GDKH01013945.1.p2 GENE.GDKH01013945.1~~GDKH01013945.1.p2  ORF type:complete len:81 (+),score=10.73 GDKH01013945.1:29-271(+)